MTQQRHYRDTTNQAPTESAKSVLLTLLGEFAVPAQGGIWTGTAISSLASLGFSDRNVRQALSRLSQDGVISPHRNGRRTHWQLTGDGQQLLLNGAKRIYDFGQRAEPWDRHWLLVMCSIPESRREKRRKLQAQLAFAGFGFLSPTVAISPHTDAEGEAAEILRGLELDTIAVVLKAAPTDATQSADLVDRSWNLEELASGYQRFLDTFESLHPENPEEAHTATVELVHAWRKFPFIDPELPTELLPQDWVGLRARNCFRRSRTSWAQEAQAHFNTLEASHQ